MPIIQICGVPDRVSEESLIPLMNNIKRGVSHIRELGLTEGQITVYFPKDRIQEVLGEEIIIFVHGLFDKPERTDAVRTRMAECLVEICEVFFAKIFKHTFLIECIPDPPFKPQKGFATKCVRAAR